MQRVAALSKPEPPASPPAPPAGAPSQYSCPGLARVLPGLLDARGAVRRPQERTGDDDTRRRMGVEGTSPGPGGQRPHRPGPPPQGLPDLSPPGAEACCFSRTTTWARPTVTSVAAGLMPLRPTPGPGPGPDPQPTSSGSDSRGKRAPALPSLVPLVSNGLTAR